MTDNTTIDTANSKKCINEMSFEGVKKFLRDNPDKPNDVDTIGDNPGACWVGACYILNCLGIPFCVGGHKPPKYTHVVTADDLAKMNGWVHLFAESEQEMHYFSLFIESSENKATLVQVYGTFMRKNIILSEWFKLLKEKKWVELFSIPRKYKLKRIVDSIEVFKL